jgi:hypothetical protein
LLWAASSERARNETFNITNGDVFSWPNVWPVVANALGFAVGAPFPVKLSAWLPSKADIWDRVVTKYSLRAPPLARYLGESHFYTDFVMATGATRAPRPAIVSTVKLRQAGFGDCIDTEQMLHELLIRLTEKRLAPLYRYS